MFVQDSGPHDKHDVGDKYSRNWLTTPLGQFLAMIIVVIVGVFLVYNIKPSMQRTDNRAASPTAQLDVQRTFDETEAVDFVQETYDGYFKSINLAKIAAADSKRSEVYDRNTMLLRLENVRPRLSPVLYTTMRIAYVNAAESATDRGIKRDEFVCSPYNFTHVATTLKQKDDDVVTVTVTRLQDKTPAGSFEALVNTKDRTITDRTCK